MQSKRKVLTSVKYNDVVSYHGKIEFYKIFISKLKEGLTRYVSLEDATKITDLLKDKTLNISNPEIFLDEAEIISDLCLKAFSEDQTLEEYIHNVAYRVKEEMNKGASSIVLTDFSLNLNYFLSQSTDSSKDEPPHFTPLLESFFLALSTNNENPITIRILDSMLSEAAMRKYNPAIFKKVKPHSEEILKAFHSALVSFQKFAPAGLNPPKIEIVRAIYNDKRTNQLAYLHEVFYNISPAKIKKAIKGVDSLENPDSQLEVALESLSSMTGAEVEVEPVMLELQRIAKECQKKTYNAEDEKKLLKEANLSKENLQEFDIKTTYIDYEAFKESAIPVFSEVKINCKGKSIDEIKVLIGYAHYINLVKRQNMSKVMHTLLKISLYNVELLQEDFTKFIKERKRKLVSVYNCSVVFEVQYSDKTAHGIRGMGTAKYIRVISDVHADVNRGKGYFFNFGDDFVINCGDVSGDSSSGILWTKGNMRRGLFTHGNHLGYSFVNSDLNSPENMDKYNSYIHPANTYTMQMEAYKNAFNFTNVGYLNNSCYMYNDVLFVGSCLYTDFCLFGEDKQKKCMQIAKSGMNDFRYKYILTSYKKKQTGVREVSSKKVKPYIRTVEPIDYLDNFIQSVNYIDNILELNKGIPVVVFTHFAPLPFSVVKKYKKDMLSAAFASDLRWLFKKHKNIRLWLHGHTHSKLDYIYEGTRVICNPFGYYNENDNKLPLKYGTRVSFEDIKSTSSWRTLLVKEILDGSVKIFEEK